MQRTHPIHCARTKFVTHPHVEIWTHSVFSTWGQTRILACSSSLFSPNLPSGRRTCALPNKVASLQLKSERFLTTGGFSSALCCGEKRGGKKVGWPRKASAVTTSWELRAPGSRKDVIVLFYGRAQPTLYLFSSFARLTFKWKNVRATGMRVAVKCLCVFLLGVRVYL